MTTNWITSARPCDFSGFKDAFGTGVGSMLTVHELGLVARVCTFFRDQVTRRTLAVAALEIQQASAPLAERVSADYEATFEPDERVSLSIFQNEEQKCSDAILGIRTTPFERSLLFMRLIQSCGKYMFNSKTSSDELTRRRHLVFERRLTVRVTDCLLKKEDEWALNPDWETLRRAELQERGDSAATIDERIETQRGELAVIAAAQDEKLRSAQQMLESFISRETLTRSFNRVFNDKAVPQNSRWQRWAGRDLELARETARGSSELDVFLRTDAGKKLSSARFLEIQAIAERSEDEIEKNWERFAVALRAQGVGIQGESYLSCREWIEDDRNRGILERVERLEIEEATDIPRAIERLQELKSLRFIGRITHLPNELARLPNLQNLTFYNSSFVEVPALLQDLPALSHLRIFQNSIRELPDGIARKLHTNRLGMLARSAYEQFLDEGWMWKYSNELYLGLKRWDLERIPFYIALEELSLPYSPYYFLATPLIIPGWLIGEIIRGCFGEVPNFLNAFWNGVLYSFAFITAPLVLLLNLPIFAYNLLLNLAIEPVVTYFRDRLGYSRMVDV
ncbi:MAG: leucine-rich repeat domain-containing protein [Chlamydiales bacterium]|nr:leucine-rich repeat domain-containing protein [Chlamydiales bacterium]